MTTLHPDTARPPAPRRAANLATDRPTHRPTNRYRKSGMTPAKPTVDSADWDLLFQAVLARLTQAVAARPAGRQDLAAAVAAADQVQATVLECVEALSGLQTLRHPGAAPQCRITAATPHPAG